MILTTVSIFRFVSYVIVSLLHIILIPNHFLRVRHNLVLIMNNVVVNREIRK